MAPDYSTWLTKDKAAAVIGCSTKFVEQLASAKKIDRGVCRLQGRGPERVVYNPDDVARMAQARRPAARPFVLEREQDGPVNGNGPRGGALQPATSQLPTVPPGEALLRALAEHFAAALLAGVEQPVTSEKSEKWLITVREAAAIVGLGPKFLRRQIAEGKLACERVGSVLKIDREDLEDWRRWRQQQRARALRREVEPR